MDGNPSMTDKGKGKGGPAVPPKPGTGTWPEFLRKLRDRCSRAFLEWLAHSLLLFGIMAVIQALHWGLINILRIPANKAFFGKVSLEYLVDSADFTLLVGIGIVGVVAAVRSYLGKA